MLAPAAPRTQEARRATTRAALLDATVRCLVERGYAGTTTTEIVARAGVSQGALFKHFPTRAALIAAAAESLFAALVHDFERAFAAGAPSGDRVAVAFRRLWDVFCDARLRAVWSLYAEAPTDPELRAALAPVVRAHGERVRGFALALFPEARGDAPLEAVLDAIVLAMQGASLQRGTYLDPARERRTLANLENLARLVFASAAGGGPAHVTSPPRAARPSTSRAVRRSHR